MLRAINNFDLSEAWVERPMQRGLVTHIKALLVDRH
jgi:hypothetical protein